MAREATAAAPAAKTATATAAGIPGVAQALRPKLDKLGLRRELDLVLHLPLRYEP